METLKKILNMSKVNTKNTRATFITLFWFLFIFNLFHTFFYCFSVRLWTSKCSQNTQKTFGWLLLLSVTSLIPEVILGKLLASINDHLFSFESNYYLWFSKQWKYNKDLKFSILVFKMHLLSISHNFESLT